MDLLHKYFGDLPAEQLDQFRKLTTLFLDWNSKINLISRKDTEHFVERHLLHSLSIQKFIQFKAQARILDLGTGGGFPGLPLAIINPNVSFTLVDSIGKKINVVNDLIKQLDLDNVQAHQRRVEEQPGHFDFIITRAVAQSAKLISWTNGKIAPLNNHSLPNGIIALKGGELQEELNQINWAYTKAPLKDYFEEAFFETKAIIHLYRQHNK